MARIVRINYNCLVAVWDAGCLLLQASCAVTKKLEHWATVTLSHAHTHTLPHLLIHRWLVSTCPEEGTTMPPPQLDIVDRSVILNPLF